MDLRIHRSDGRGIRVLCPVNKDSDLYKQLLEVAQKLYDESENVSR